MTGEDRSLVLWALSSLMVAEERITTKFSGLVGAYGTEEEATFLATQQVDEARHMQFYARFQDEVIADPQTIGTHVTRAREQLSPAFSEIFDKALVQAHERLVAAPADAGRKGGLRHHVPHGHRGHPRADRVQLHLRVPRAGVAARRLRRGLHRGSTTTSSATSATAPGSCARRSETTRRSATTSARRCAALLPAVAQALTPPDREGTDWDALGASSEEIRDFAVTGLSRRLNIVGVPLDSSVTQRASEHRPTRRGRGPGDVRARLRGLRRDRRRRPAHGGLGVVGVALVFGLVIMVMVYATGHLSGAHINPAVTVAFTLTRHFPARDAVAYVAAQVAGAVAGRCCCSRYGPIDPAGLGATVPTVGAGSALVYEIVLTAFLMFVIMAVATDTRAVGAAAAIAIGGAVGLDALFGGPVTGASMNPARSFGPALAAGEWTDFWIYVVGPFLGAAAGALAYQLVRGPAPVRDA